MDDPPDQPSQRHQVISLSGLCAGLSPERLAAYSLLDDTDSTDALARYLWNGALCAAFHAPLHALEVTLRNSLFRASSAIVDTRGRAPGSTGCWLDVTPSLLLDREAAEVQEAKRRLGQNPRFHTPGRLIAKLGFGFWTSLCQAPYEHGRLDGPRLWPRAISRAFPHLPKPLRYRAKIAEHLNAVREFRNRIAHHEPIWDRGLLVRHDEILDALAWIHPTMRDAARRCSGVELTVHNGPAAFRTTAATLLGCES